MTPLARAVAVDDDLALTRRIVGGERAAFEVLMRRYNRRLFRLARATLRHAARRCRGRGRAAGGLPGGLSLLRAVPG